MAGERAHHGLSRFGVAQQQLLHLVGNAAAAGEKSLGIAHVRHIAQSLHNLLQLAFHHIALAVQTGEASAGEGVNGGLGQVLQGFPEGAGGHITHAQYMARGILAQQVIATVQQVGTQFLAQATGGFGQHRHAESLRQPEHGFLLVRVQGANDEHQALHGTESEHLGNLHQRTAETGGGRSFGYLDTAEIRAGRFGICIQADVQVQRESLAEGVHQIG